MLASVLTLAVLAGASSEQVAAGGGCTPQGWSYYVATNGNDGWPGTCEQPFRTIARAMMAIGSSTGKAVLVRQGNYAERLDCTGHSGGPEMFNAFVSEVKFGAILSTTDTMVNEVVDLDCDYFWVEGFKVSGAASADGGTNVDFDTGADHNWFIRNAVTGANCQGVFAGPTTSDNLITRNLIHNNGVAACDRQAHGIYVQGTRNEVNNNVVYDHPEGSGIHNFESATDTRILYNTSAHNGSVNGVGCFCGHGIVIDDSTGRPNNGTIAVGNIVYDNSQDGFYWGNGAMHGTCATVSYNLADSNDSDNYDPSDPPPTSCFLPPTAPGSTNYVGDPAFVNYANRDFHITLLSKARDRGESTYAPSNDYGGCNRPFGPVADIGAFEYTTQTDCVP